MKYEMVESFFDDLADYMRFFLKLKEAKRATSDFSCVATLKKEDGKYLYTLEWKDGQWVGEYVRPFRANEEHLRIFHAGCAETARRLRIYIETGDIDQVTKAPPATLKVNECTLCPIPYGGDLNCAGSPPYNKRLLWTALRSASCSPRTGRYPMYSCNEEI